MREGKPPRPFTHCVREQRGFAQAGERECGSAWSTVGVTLHPSAEDQPLPYQSVPNSPRHSIGGSKQFQACSFCSMVIATQGARELPGTADIGDKPLQRAREGKKPPWSQDVQWTAQNQCPLKADRCGRMSTFCSADVSPPGSHSVYVVVTHFPAELGQTMQKVKTGALGGRLVLPSHCTKGIVSQLQEGRSDFPSQHDLEEDSSSLGLYCIPSSDLLGYKGVPHPGCGLPTVCVSYSPQPSSNYYLN